MSTVIFYQPRLSFVTNREVIRPRRSDIALKERKTKDDSPRRGRLVITRGKGKELFRKGTETAGRRLGSERKTTLKTYTTHMSRKTKDRQVEELYD